MRAVHRLPRVTKSHLQKRSTGTRFFVEENYLRGGHLGDASVRRKWALWSDLEAKDESERMKFATFLFHIEEAVARNRGDTPKFPARMQSDLHVRGESRNAPLDLDTVMQMMEDIAQGEQLEPHTVHGIIDRVKKVTCALTPSDTPSVGIQSD